MEDASDKGMAAINGKAIVNVNSAKEKLRNLQQQTAQETARHDKLQIASQQITFRRRLGFDNSSNRQ
uniref:Uncharacterized protein n=1 Tax=Globodera rostochiensis TaxID=31243 RepID=A0A914IAG8_GLORO